MADGNAGITPIEPGVDIIPNPGDYVWQFNRYYLCINPNVALGPPTWRISDPDEYPCDGDVIIDPPCDDEINGGIYYPEFIIDCPDIDSGTYDPDVPGIGDDIDGGLYAGSDINTIDSGIYNPELITEGSDIDSGTYDPDVPGIGDDLDGLGYI